jgi:ketosteroid isomerase-like protein
MKRFALISSCCCVIVAVALLRAPQLNSRLVPAGDDTMETEIRAIILEQQAAWNRGDIDAFMKGYWNSPDLTFAGSSGVTRGWKPVLDRYRERYGNAQATMGQLDFSNLEVHSLEKDAAFVLGRWHLNRASGEMGGVFTLIFQHFPEGWRIVHDHTSADDKK